MASKKKDSDVTSVANMKTIVEMLKRQENNMNRRLDMLENKLDSFKLEIGKSIKGLEERVKVVEKSAEFIANQYESQKKTANNLLKKQSSLSEENEQLKKEIKALRLDQEKQKYALNDLEQFGRRECVEISGVPPQDGEDVEAITIAIGKEIGVDVGKNDITACHRIKKAKGDPIIIAKFLNRKKKEEFLAKRRNLKAKTLGSLKLTDDEAKKNGKIYLNESLTRINRELFRFARLKCSENGWKFAWTKNGVVSVKKNENTTPTRIASLKELEQKVN